MSLYQGRSPGDDYECCACCLSRNVIIITRTNPFGIVESSAPGPWFRLLRRVCFTASEKIDDSHCPHINVPRFGDGLGDNLKAFFSAGPRGDVRSGLLVDWNQEPSLWQNLRDWIAPRKLPPQHRQARLVLGTGG